MTNRAEKDKSGGINIRLFPPFSSFGQEFLSILIYVVFIIAAHSTKESAWFVSLVKHSHKEVCPRAPGHLQINKSLGIGEAGLFQLKDTE